MSEFEPTQHTREDLVKIAGEPVTLNLGSGDDPRGVGIDLNYDTADINANLNNGIPVEDAAADNVLAEHVLEHLENPSQFLREVKRVLKPEGVAEIEVPNAGWLPVRLYITQDIQRFWEHKIPGEGGHWLARSLGNEDPDRTQHLTLWTKVLLANHLDRAGFSYEFLDSHFLSRNLRVKAWPTND